MASSSTASWGPITKGTTPRQLTMPRKRTRSLPGRFRCNYKGSSMALFFEEHAKLGAINRAPRYTPRVLLKTISTVVGSVQDTSLFKHTTTHHYCCRRYNIQLVLYRILSIQYDIIRRETLQHRILFCLSSTLLTRPYRWIEVWRCTCRDWPFSSASKPIDLGLG